MYRASPSLVFAVIGQARADGKLSPEDESLLLCKLLTFWALRATLNMSEICAAAPVARSAAQHDDIKEDQMASEKIQTVELQAVRQPAFRAR